MDEKKIQRLLDRMEIIDIETGQGYEIGRPSSLFLRAHQEKGTIKVTVGGRVISIAEGYWG